MQELRKSQNQDLRADLAWSMNSGKMESNPGDFAGFRRLEGSKLLWPKGFRDSVTLMCWVLP